MNLYKIIFSHHAPKGSEKGIRALLLAKNDYEVYEWIASEPEIGDRHLYNSWKDTESNESDSDYVYWYDEDENGELESFKTRMLRLNGQIDDHEVDFSDSYYGLSLLGWELLKENVDTDYSELIELGIIFKYSK